MPSVVVVKLEVSRSGLPVGWCLWLPVEGVSVAGVSRYIGRDWIGFGAGGAGAVGPVRSSRRLVLRVDAEHEAGFGEAHDAEGAAVRPSVLLF